MIAWLALCWLGGVASAATVAVLDFDGYGLSFSDAQTVAQGVRDAFLEEGALDPLSGSDIADGVSKGQDDALRRARELVSEGRRLYSAGDASGALSPLHEAIRLHDGAFSDVGRRPELADATFLLGLCFESLGQGAEAKLRFAEAASLVPSYAKERGTRMSSSAAALLAAAEDTNAKGPRRTRPEDEVGRIAASLAVDYVVTGWVSADGAVSARMYAGGQLVSEVKAALEETPPLPVDAAYNEIVRQLAEGGSSAPAVVAEPEADLEVDAEVEDLDPEALAEADPGPPPDFGEDDAARAPGRSATARPAGGTRIKASGPMRYKRPLHEQWWFWTGAVAVAGGGAFGIWYAATPPPVEYVEEPDGWTVTVQVPPAAE